MKIGQPTKVKPRKVGKPSSPKFNTAPMGQYNQGKSDAKTKKVPRRTTGSGGFMKTT